MPKKAPSKSKLPQVRTNKIPENGYLQINLPNTTKMSVPSRWFGVLDTGVEVEVEPGYRLCFSLVPEFSSKGLVATNAPGRFVSGKVTINLLNAGRDIIVLNQGDALAEVWIEKETPFEWRGQ